MKAAWSPNGCLTVRWPDGIRDARENFIELAQLFKQLDAPKGKLGRASLVWSNRSVTAADKVYAGYLKRIGDITVDRNELAARSRRC